MEIEVQAVHGHELGQEHGFKLGLALQTIAKHEASFLARMSV